MWLRAHPQSCFKAICRTQLPHTRAKPKPSVPSCKGPRNDSPDTWTILQDIRPGERSPASSKPPLWEPLCQPGHEQDIHWHGERSRQEAVGQASPAISQATTQLPSSQRALCSGTEPNGAAISIILSAYLRKIACL